MSRIVIRIRRLIEQDPRYKFGAYQFIQETLGYAQKLKLGELQPTDFGEEAPDPDQPEVAQHLTGPQLCEAARQYALEEYGFLAKSVLNNLGIHSTSDIGEVVYNLIGIGMLKKSKRDRREDFDGVFEFDEAFRYEVRIPRS